MTRFNTDPRPSPWYGVFSMARALEKNGKTWASAGRLYRRDLVALAASLPW